MNTIFEFGFQNKVAILKGLVNKIRLLDLLTRKLELGNCIFIEVIHHDHIVFPTKHLK